jgi:methionine--tRNA ligase beta chain
MSDRILNMEKIDFDTFKKVEMKVGQIIEISRVEGADKLYKLTVDVAEVEPRQIVTGLVPFYNEAELLDKKIIVVSNLKPAKFRGEESNGMLLAAGSEEGGFSILTLDREAPIGSIVS